MGQLSLPWMKMFLRSEISGSFLRGSPRSACSRPMCTRHGGSGLSGASGFITRKFEDVRGVDHEQARRERRVKLERKIDDLTGAIELAKRTSEGFDNEVVKEINDFERIKRAEFKLQLGGLADAHIDYYGKVTSIWEQYAIFGATSSAQTTYYDRFIPLTLLGIDLR
ncbi:Sorting nexin-4 like protein [Verticillium longisporum]|nr:Sorting nexin-4 like protein [Verticillium longisporum]